MYIVFNVLYLNYTIYLTFLFYFPPAFAMSCNWSIKNGATFCGENLRVGEGCHIPPPHRPTLFCRFRMTQSK